MPCINYTMLEIMYDNEPHHAGKNPNKTQISLCFSPWVRTIFDIPWKLGLLSNVRCFMSRSTFSSNVRMFLWVDQVSQNENKMPCPRKQNLVDGGEQARHTQPTQSYCAPGVGVPKVSLYSSWITTPKKIKIFFC